MNNAGRPPSTTEKIAEYCTMLGSISRVCCMVAGCAANHWSNKAVSSNKLVAKAVKVSLVSRVNLVLHLIQDRDKVNKASLKVKVLVELVNSNRSASGREPLTSPKAQAGTAKDAPVGKKPERVFPGDW